MPARENINMLPASGFEFDNQMGVCLECPSPRLVGELAVRGIPIINTLRQEARNINKHISVGWEGWLMTLVSENCYWDNATPLHRESPFTKGGS